VIADNLARYGWKVLAFTFAGLFVACMAFAIAFERPAASWGGTRA
jgi:hypothetical protein